jgi:hypothetical protein
VVPRAERHRSPQQVWCIPLRILPGCRVELGGVALLEVVKEASSATAWPLWDKQCKVLFDSWSDACVGHHGSAK